MFYKQLSSTVLLCFFLIGHYNGELIIQPVCFFRVLCIPLPHYFGYDVAKSVSLLFLNGTTPDDYEEFPLAESRRILNNSAFDINNVTVIYMHGFTEEYQAESVQTVMGAYLQRGGFNLIVVDARRAMSGINYLVALKTVPTLTKAVAAAVDNMVRSGLDLSRIHIIGHSLGGQAAGYLGMYIKSGLVHRITALDPSAFNIAGLRRPLDEKVAEMVDIIHTDIGFLGDLSPALAIDFYPNGGRSPQPGCGIDTVLCNHQRSWEYYSESVLYEEAFPAVKCDDWKSFTEGKCDMNANGPVYMGILCNTNAVGKYYLRTNDKPPFGLGSHLQPFNSSFS
ncbi:pancreatic triacylglycerol lipase [Anabrus simplex]|uniref:pancreatic triacylglycerol lipase n=1 Tax=Anabrus simplex TaxID=316456 RepID=UPI0035A2689D